MATTKKHPQFTDHDDVPPFGSAGGRSPRQYAAFIADLAHQHSGYGWSWHMRICAYMLAYYGPNDAEWERDHGQIESPPWLDPHIMDAEAADMLRYNYWKPIFHIPAKRRVEVKNKEGDAAIIDTKELGAAHWEKLGWIGWRDIRMPPPKVVTSAEDAAPPARPKLKQLAPPLRWPDKPAASAAPAPKARPRFINGQLSPILEAPAPSKRPRLGDSPAAPAKPPRPRLGAALPGLLDRD